MGGVEEKVRIEAAQAVASRNMAAGQTPQSPASESNARTAALQLHIIDLEAQLAALSKIVAEERAKSASLEAGAPLQSTDETELRILIEARDAAEAVAAAAAAELREVRAMRDALLRERDAAYAAASAAEARIGEPESLLAQALGSANDSKTGREGEK